MRQVKNDKYLNILIHPASRLRQHQPSSRPTGAPPPAKNLADSWVGAKMGRRRQEPFPTDSHDNESTLAYLKGMDEFLKDLLSQPTAPFRESHVKKCLADYLAKHKIPHFEDPVGNLIVGVHSKSEYLKRVQRKTSEPLRVFIAHMDHPGFHGVKWVSPTKLAVRWYGGSPTAYLDGAPVWVATDKGWAGEGVLGEPVLTTSKLRLDRSIIEFSAASGQTKLGKASQIFGMFRFRSPVWKESDLIYTKAADDLVGAYNVVRTAVAISNKKSRDSFLGLLTRAEEVGFIGAIGHFQLGWLKRAKRMVFCVSLEASRTMAGAEIGKGPVVRLGDRATVFDPSSLEILTQVARKVLPKKHQRKVMDGGTCEATAAVAFGFPAIGLSVPLGNYHNQSFEGGPDSRGPLGPAPEFIHQGDIEGVAKLCVALLQPNLNWKKPWEGRLKEFQTLYRKYRRLLS